jgi:hypothetical protein
LTESVDYSEPDIIYDEEKEGFQDEESKKIGFAFPVSASFNLPQLRQTTTESAKPEPTTTLTATTTTEQEQPSTTTEPTTRYREVTTTTTSAPEVETTTRLFRRRWFTTTLRPTTEEASTTPELTTEASPQQEDQAGGLDEVYLGGGTQIPVDQTSGSSPDTPYQIIDISKPLYPTKDRSTSLWSVYKQKKESRPAWGAVHNDAEHELDDTEESNTEGYNVASIMSYATPDDGSDDNNDIKHEKENDSDDHENNNNNSADNNGDITRTSSSVSKVFSYSQPSLPNYPHGEIKIHSFGKELTTTTSKSPTTERETGSGVSKKREWIKNWVSRNYNKAKFPRGPFIPVTSQITETSTTSTTPSPVENEIEPVQPVKKASLSSSFPPTVPPPSPEPASTTTTTSTPKNPRFTVNLDVTVRDGSEEKTSGSVYDKSALYDKYTNRKKATSLFLNRDQPQYQQPWIKEVQQQQESSPVVAVPNFRPAAILGANPERIRSYGGRQLSQSDFERSILGVSTATEISVKSVICVKGQCFNANEGKYKSK